MIHCHKIYCHPIVLIKVEEINYQAVMKTQCYLLTTTSETRQQCHDECCHDTKILTLMQYQPKVSRYWYWNDTTAKSYNTRKCNEITLQKYWALTWDKRGSIFIQDLSCIIHLLTLLQKLDFDRNLRFSLVSTVVLLFKLHTSGAAL